MSSPARGARLAAAANGFNEVKSRHRNGITLSNPSTGKCCFETQVGQIYHYGPSFEEADSAWEAGVAPWNYQMVKADFNLFALANFSNGQILKWLDPASGQYVTFQPMGLNWVNQYDAIQQISMPQSVAAQVSDDVLYWPAAYGAGRNFKYVASTTRLNKLLIIDSAASLPSTSYDTLELNFIMGMGSGVTPYIDSGNGLQAWDKKTQRDTVKTIEFRLSNGTVVWSFAAPTAYDSAEGSTTGTMRLKKSGSSLYVSIRFPKAWIDTAQFPIYLDPTVDYQIGASADDGEWAESAWTNTTTSFSLGSRSTEIVNVFFRFASVEIPNGATIDAAYVSFYFNSVTGASPPACTFTFEDADNPDAITSISDGDSRVRTTNSISITGPSSGTWWNSNSIVDIISELCASFDYSSAAAMQGIISGPEPNGTSRRSTQRTYDYTGNTSGPKLHVEYTEAATGTILPILAAHRRRRMT